MNSYVQGLSSEEWEPFCEIMLRQHFGAKNFYSVPDQDQGDLGVEFYTVHGTIFQCYSPEKGIEMSEFKKRIQKKINADLKKLKKNETEIANILDDILIDQWVLLTPENKSKDLLAYCSKKKKEVVKENLAFVDSDNFTVKIETADSYPHGKLYAQGVFEKAVDIPLEDASDSDKVAWKTSNAEFASNVVRKSEKMVGPESEQFQDHVVARYIQIEKFLDQLRADYPDLHELVEDSSFAQLQNMKDKALLESETDKEFIKNVVSSNEAAFNKYAIMMSDSNVQSLSFGYLSKWLAECYMDFQ